MGDALCTSGHSDAVLEGCEAGAQVTELVDRAEARETQSCFPNGDRSNAAVGLEEGEAIAVQEFSVAGEGPS